MREPGTRPQILEADVKLGYGCNLSCCHCAVASNRGIRDLTFGEVVRDLEEYAAMSPDRLVLTGGEPTLRHDLPEIVEFARRVGFRQVELQTNGVLLRNGDLARSLALAGVTGALVSLHGPTASVHEKITRRRGCFAKTVVGVHNLASLGVTVMTNTVVTRLNLKWLPDLTDEFIRLFPNMRTLSLSYPRAVGEVKDHFRELVPSVSETSEYLIAAVETAKRQGVWVWVSDFPLCGLPGYEEHSSHAVCVQAIGTDLGCKVSGGRGIDYTALIRGEKRKGPQCVTCALDVVCPGVDARYAYEYGLAELVPAVAPEESSSGISEKVMGAE